MLSCIFSTILEMTFTASIIAVIVISLRFIIKDRISKSLILLFWAILFIKLAIPFEISSPTSIFNALPDKNITQNIGNVFLQSSTISGIHENSQQQKVENNTVNIIPTPTFTQSENKSTVTQNGYPNLMHILPCIWIFVTFSLLIFYIINYFIVLFRFKKAIIIKNEFMYKLIEQYKLKRKVRIFRSTSVKSPAVFGIIRPKIILPFDFDFENETIIKYILTHEMQHIKRQKKCLCFI